MLSIQIMMLLSWLQQTPDTVVEPSFCGAMVESEPKFILHKQRPNKFVVVEGTDSGSRFLGCVAQVKKN